MGYILWEFLNNLPEASINYPSKNVRNTAILGNSLRPLPLFKTDLTYIFISKIYVLHTNIYYDGIVTFIVNLILEVTCLQVRYMGIGTMSYSS